MEKETWEESKFHNRVCRYFLLQQAGIAARRPPIVTSA